MTQGVAEMKNSLLAIVAGASLLLQVSVALADGDGPPPRPLTAEEKNFFLRTNQAFNSALPTPPTGWELVEVSPLAAPDEIYDQWPYSVSFKARYRSLDYTARKERLEEAFLESYKMTPEEEAVWQQLHKENEELAGRFGQAVQRRDHRETEKINLKMKTVGEKMEAFGTARDKKAKQITDPLLLKDAEAEIHFETAFQGSSLVGKSLLPFAEGAAAFRDQEGWSSSNSGWVEGTTLAFLGRWLVIHETEESPAIAPAYQLGTNPLDIQAISVSIRAADKRAEQLLRQINYSHLTALLKGRNPSAPAATEALKRGPRLLAPVYPGAVAVVMPAAGTSEWMDHPWFGNFSNRRAFVTRDEIAKVRAFYDKSLGKLDKGTLPKNHAILHNSEPEDKQLVSFSKAANRFDKDLLNTTLGGEAGIEIYSGFHNPTAADALGRLEITSRSSSEQNELPGIQNRFKHLTSAIFLPAGGAQPLTRDEVISAEHQVQDPEAMPTLDLDPEQLKRKMEKAKAQGNIQEMMAIMMQLQNSAAMQQVRNAQMGHMSDARQQALRILEKLEPEAFFTLIVIDTM
jgi:hypothetical protein